MPKKATGKVGKDGLVALTVRLKPAVWGMLDQKSIDTRIPKTILVEMLLARFIEGASIEFGADGVPRISRTSPRAAKAANL